MRNESSLESNSSPSATTSVASRSRRVKLSAALTAALSAGFVAGLPLGPAASIASAAVAPQSGSYWAHVKGDNVMVRSGPSVQSAYAIGRLSAGQPVKVVAVEYGWAKVAAVGPAFTSMFAYVKADSNSSYDAAAKSLTVTGKADLIAANMDVGYAPEKSWKLLGTVATGEKLTVIEEKKAGSDTFYSVRMPTSTEVWVNNQFLGAATQEEADAIESALRGGTPIPPPMVVTPSPTATPTPAGTPTATPTATPGQTPGQTPGTPRSDRRWPHSGWHHSGWHHSGWHHPRRASRTTHPSSRRSILKRSGRRSRRTRRPRPSERPRRPPPKNAVASRWSVSSAR
jgi:uncharacterized protein YgiM (DUF1202 family)